MSEEQQPEVKTEHLKNVTPPLFKKDSSLEEIKAELTRYKSEIDSAAVQDQLQRAEELKPPDNASLGAKLGYILGFNNQVSALGKPQVDGEVLRSAEASGETTTITPSLKTQLTSNISATSDSFLREVVPETVLNEAVGKAQPEPPLSERQLKILASIPKDYSKLSEDSVQPLEPDKTTEDENVMNGKRQLKKSGDYEIPTDRLTGDTKKSKKRKITKKKKKSKKRKTKRKYKTGKRN